MQLSNHFVRCLLSGAAGDGRVVLPTVDFVADLLVPVADGFDGVRLIVDATGLHAMHLIYMTSADVV